MRSLFLLPLLLGFSVPAIAESKTYTINVLAEDYRKYILNGTDRNGSVSGNDPTVKVTKGIQLFLILTHLVIRST